MQSISRESNDKDMVAMLDELTIEANEESFVIGLQHGESRNMRRIHRRKEKIGERKVISIDDL